MCTSQDPTVNPSSVSFLPMQTEGSRVVQRREQRDVGALESPGRATEVTCVSLPISAFSHTFFTLLSPLFPSLCLFLFCTFSVSFFSPHSITSSLPLCITYVPHCNCFIMWLFILWLCSLRADTHKQPL